jgi:hypothetical protein
MEVALVCQVMAQVFWQSGPTHGDPLFVLSKSIWRGTHGTKPHQQPLSAWQRSFGLENSSISPSSEVVECFVLSQTISRVSENSNECHQVYC